MLEGVNFRIAARVVVKSTFVTTIIKNRISVRILFRLRVVFMVMIALWFSEYDLGCILEVNSALK